MTGEIRFYPEDGTERQILLGLDSPDNESYIKQLLMDTDEDAENNLLPVSQRLLVIDALAQLVNELFKMIKQDMPEPRACHEYGCGATAFFYRHLLPEELKPYWQQFELLPVLAERAKRDNHGANINQGDIYHMQAADNSLDLILCYSSLDSMVNIEAALVQVRQKLRVGGLLIAIQDIAPSRSVLMREYLKRHRINPRRDNAVRYKDGGAHHIVDWLEVGGKQVDSNDYFHNDLVEAVTASGLVLVDHKRGMTSTVETDRRPQHNTDEYRGKNVFAYADGKQSELYDPRIPEGKVQQTVKVDIVLAGKE